MVTLGTFFKRTGYVLFWIIAIFVFLYVGRAVKYFQHKNSINVFLWSGVIDPKMFARFEKETGIHVNASYYEGNEELLVKLLATKGKGYDMIVPSDYIVEFLIKNDLLQKIDKSKLDFFQALNPKFLGRYYDPKNDYSVPSEWYLEGIGINLNHFKDGILPESSWSSIFDPKKTPSSIGLFNDSREMTGLAIKYLYGQVRPIDKVEMDEVTRLLQKQKEKVEAYTDFRGDFLLRSGNCALVTAPSSFMWKTVKENPHIQYMIPQEGTFLNIENYVIPSASKKADMVYKLWNFLFQLDVQRHNFHYGSFLSTRRDADFMFEVDELKSSIDLIHPASSEDPELFQNKLTDDQINQIWLEVKGF